MGKAATGRGRAGGGSKKFKSKGKKSFKSAAPRPRPTSDSDESDGSEGEEGGGGLEAMLARIKGLRSDESEGDEDFEDEELDSDMADTDGEEGPVQKKPKKSSGSTTKGRGRQEAEIDLNEDEPEFEEQEAQEDGMVDLSTMLDLQPPSEEDSDSDQSAKFSDDEADSDDVEQEEALNKLNAFVQGLPGQQHQSADGEEGAGSKKRKLTERTETQPESEFAPVNQSKKLRLEDMLATLPAGQAKEVKKSIKPMLKSQDSGTQQQSDSAGTSTLQRTGPLPAPLDSRSQARLDRQAAREKLSGEVDKWNASVSQMKGIGSKDSEIGQHRITLPLNAPDLKSRPSAAELSSKFKASNDLEQAISGLLESSAVSNPAQQAQSEQELMAKMRLSAEDQAARLAAVRRQRELMFRAERKNKRLNKIKSKTYRRLARKEAKNDGLSMEELEQLDELDEGSRAAEARARMETQRAKERASLRHSSKSTKFAKDVNGMYGLEVDDELRQGEVDRVKREAALRKKIAGQASGSESEQEDSDLEEGDDEAIRAAALRSLDRAATKDQQEAVKAEEPKGLMGMKFMRAAQARKEAEQQELEDAFRRQMEGDDVPEDADQNHAIVQGNAGRRVFVPNKTAATDDTTILDEDAHPMPRPMNKTGKNKTKSQTISVDAPPQPSTSTAESAAAVAPVNPWLAAASGASTSKVSTKDPKQVTAADKANLKARKQKSKNADERVKQQQESQVELDPSQVLVKEKKKPRQRKSKAEKKEAREQLQSSQPKPQDGGAATKVDGPTLEPAVAGVDGNEDQSSQDEDGEFDDDDDQMVFRQRDLVARAFAGDDVVADFEAEKAREVEGDAPQDVDVTIPGWGSWGGKGVRRKPKKAAPKKFTKHIAGVDAASRKDAGLNHVILSEKREKQAAKYLVKDLPFPYTSAAQHEQALRMPTGPEWQTGTTHRSFTRPEVLTRMGQIIDPLSRQ